MALHLIKLCVGALSIDDLAAWQRGRIAARKKAGLTPFADHTTFQMPKRHEELLAGGSLYWVMKGTITVRQSIVGLEDGSKEDGTPCCVILLDPTLVPVRPIARRPFQGWRYLAGTDAPADLSGAAEDDLAAMPARMRKALADLCLI